MIDDHSLPFLVEHGKNLAMLQSLPPNTLDWSMLCPSQMNPESFDFTVPTKSSHARLTANAQTPPLWKSSWIKNIPLIGSYIIISMNTTRYVTTLEQNADFIATDLETLDSPYIGTQVGVIDASKS